MYQIHSRRFILYDDSLDTRSKRFGTGKMTILSVRLYAYSIITHAYGTCTKSNTESSLTLVNRQLTFFFYTASQKLECGWLFIRYRVI
jgi:hypothetical protein